MIAIYYDAPFLTARRTNSARRRSTMLSLAVSCGLIFGSVPLTAQDANAAPDAGAPITTAKTTAELTQVSELELAPGRASFAVVTGDSPPSDPTTDPPPASDPPPITTDPPAEPSEPPAVPTDPPADPTNPPVDSTDPPASPSTPPLEPGVPPDESGAPPATAPPTTPPSPATPLPSTNPESGPKPNNFAPSSSGASDRLSATASARIAALAKAQLALRTAQTAFADASALYDMALERYDTVIESAKQLDSLATNSEATAKESTRLFLYAVRSADNGLGPLDALFGLTPGDELLDRLGTIDQLSQASEDPVEASTRAERDNARAEVLRERADKAQAAIADIPVAALKADRDAATVAVTNAQSAVSSLQLSTTAASGALDDLPPLPSDDGRLSGQAWVLAASGSITDPFGPRPSRPAGAGAFHYGVDIGSGCRSWIVAASAGTVVSAGANGGLGNWILIDHGQGITTGYGHIENGGIVVAVGDAVVAGQAIALSGNTGMSTGCHVHIEVAIDGVRTDAVPFFAARGVGLG